MQSTPRGLGLGLGLELRLRLVTLGGLPLVPTCVCMLTHAWLVFHVSVSRNEVHFIRIFGYSANMGVSWAGFNKWAWSKVKYLFKKKNAICDNIIYIQVMK